MPERVPEAEVKAEPPSAQKRLQDASGDEVARRYTEALEKHNVASNTEQTSTNTTSQRALDSEAARARAATQAYIEALTEASIESVADKARFESWNAEISRLEKGYLDLTNGKLLAEIEKTRTEFAKNPTNQGLINRAVALEREAYWRENIDSHWTDPSKSNEVIPLARRFRPGVADLSDLETALKTLTVDDYIMQKANGGNPRDILNGFRLNNQQTLGILVQNAGLVLDAPCGEGKTIILQMSALLKNWAGQKAVIATSHTGLAQDGLKDVNEMLKFFQLMQPDFKAGYIDFHSPDKADVVRNSHLIYMTFETYGFQKIQDRAAPLSGGKRVFIAPDNLHPLLDEGDLPTTKQARTPMQLTVVPPKHSDLQKTFCLEIDKIAADMQKNLELYGLRKIDGKLIVEDTAAAKAKWSAFVNEELPKLLEKHGLTAKVLQPYNRKADSSGQHRVSMEEFRLLAECQLAQSLMVNADIHRLGFNYKISENGKSIDILNTYVDEANIGSRYMAEFPYEFFGGLNAAIEAREMHRLIDDPNTKQKRPNLTDNKNLFLHSTEKSESMLVRTVLELTPHWSATSGTANAARRAFEHVGKGVITVEKIAGRKMDLFEYAYADNDARKNAVLATIAQEMASGKNPLGIYYPEADKAGGFVAELQNIYGKDKDGKDRVLLFSHDTKANELPAIARAASKPGYIVVFTNLGGRGKDWASAYNDMLDAIDKKLSSIEKPVSLQAIVGLLRNDAEKELAIISEAEERRKTQTPDQVKGELEKLETQYKNQRISQEKYSEAKKILEYTFQSKDKLNEAKAKYDAQKAGLELFESNFKNNAGEFHELFTKTIKDAGEVFQLKKDLAASSDPQVKGAFSPSSFNLLLYGKPSGGYLDFIQALNRADRGSKGGTVYSFTCLDDEIFRKVGIDIRALIKPNAAGEYVAELKLNNLDELGLSKRQLDICLKGGLLEISRTDNNVIVRFAADFETKAEKLLKTDLTQKALDTLRTRWTQTDLGLIYRLANAAMIQVTFQDIEQARAGGGADYEKKMYALFNEFGDERKLNAALAEYRAMLAQDMYNRSEALLTMLRADIDNGVKAEILAVLQADVDRFGLDIKLDLDNLPKTAEDFAKMVNEAYTNKYNYIVPMEDPNTASPLSERRANAKEFMHRLKGYVEQLMAKEREIAELKPLAGEDLQEMKNRLARQAEMDYQNRIFELQMYFYNKLNRNILSTHIRRTDHNFGGRLSVGFVNEKTEPVSSYPLGTNDRSIDLSIGGIFGRKTTAVPVYILRADDGREPLEFRDIEEARAADIAILAEIETKTEARTESETETARTTPEAGEEKIQEVRPALDNAETRSPAAEEIRPTDVEPTADAREQAVESSRQIIESLSPAEQDKYYREIFLDEDVGKWMKRMQEIKKADVSGNIPSMQREYSALEAQLEAKSKKYAQELAVKGVSNADKLLKELDNAGGAFFIGALIALFNNKDRPIEFKLTDPLTWRQAFGAAFTNAGEKILDPQKRSEYLLSLPENTGFGVFCSVRDNLITKGMGKWLGIMETEVAARALGRQARETAGISYTKAAGKYLSNRADYMLKVFVPLFAAGCLCDGVNKIKDKYGHLLLSPDPYEQEKFMTAMVITALCEGGANVLFELSPVLMALCPAFSAIPGAMQQLMKTAAGFAGVYFGGQAIEKNIADPLIKQAWEKIDQEKARNTRRGIPPPPQLTQDEINRRFGRMNTASQIVKNITTFAGTAFATQALSKLPDWLLRNVVAKISKGFAAAGAGKVISIAGTKVIPVAGQIFMAVETGALIVNTLEDIFAPDPTKLDRETAYAMDKAMPLRQLLDLNGANGAQLYQVQLAQRLESIGRDYNSPNPVGIYFEKAKAALFGQLSRPQDQEKFKKMWAEFIDALRSEDPDKLKSFWQTAFFVKDFMQLSDGLVNPGGTGDGNICITGQEAIGNKTRFFEAVLAQAWGYFIADNVQELSGTPALLTDPDPAAQEAYKYFLENCLAQANKDQADLFWRSKFGLTPNADIASQLRKYDIELDPQTLQCAGVLNSNKFFSTYGSDNLLKPGQICAEEPEIFVDFVKYLIFEEKGKDIKQLVRTENIQYIDGINYIDTIWQNICKEFADKISRRASTAELKQFILAEILPRVGAFKSVWLKDYFNYRIKQGKLYDVTGDLDDMAERDKQIRFYNQQSMYRGTYADRVSMTINTQPRGWSLAEADTNAANLFIRQSLAALDHLNRSRPLDPAAQAELKPLIDYYKQFSVSKRQDLRNYLSGQSALGSLNLNSWSSLYDKIEIGRPFLDLLGAKQAEEDNAKASIEALNTLLQDADFQKAISIFAAGLTPPVPQRVATNQYSVLQIAQYNYQRIRERLIADGQIANEADDLAVLAIILPQSLPEEVYTVAAGDSLGKIAQKYATTVEELVRLNNIANPNLIFAGQELIIKE
jgi:hypothetical protein